MSTDRIAVSSWSLHRRLGVTFPHDLDTRAVGPRQETFGAPAIALVELPQEVARHEIQRLELCSFHLAERGAGYLDDLRGALADAGVALQTLLIEAGDISDANTTRRDRRWITDWVETAVMLGAENARVIAGKQKAGPDTLARSAEALLEIANNHAGAPINIVTENWFDLLATPSDVLDLLDRTEGQIGLNADFGNWQGAGKYDDLAEIFGRASLCHAKAYFAGGKLDERDYGRCIEVAEEAGYTGPYTLIFDSESPAEWDGVIREKEFVLSQLGA
ncbi:hypothetical protein GCM10007989_29690 [Devosia pacifica]|uniref:Xylose isomerase-like TIM barrel domain-containing protein n=1 Tax=Devosia pacifica TaxID=1335967 RepID=A0A918VXJ1_9HYPH|nr:TIM barrel protein [Devosia pacifica]GHA31686.1 hypothetical protein GCM10007989_29690 [Devosia pacifica]